MSLKVEIEKPILMITGFGNILRLTPEYRDKQETESRKEIELFKLSHFQACTV